MLILNQNLWCFFLLSMQISDFKNNNCLVIWIFKEMICLNCCNLSRCFIAVKSISLGVISTFVQTIVLSQFFFLCCQCCNYLNIYYLLLKFNREILLVYFKTYFISAAWKTDWKPRREGCQRWIPSHPLVKANPINVNRLIILKVVLVFLWT